MTCWDLSLGKSVCYENNELHHFLYYVRDPFLFVLLCSVCNAPPSLKALGTRKTIYLVSVMVVYNIARLDIVLRWRQVGNCIGFHQFSQQCGRSFCMLKECLMRAWIFCRFCSLNTLGESLFLWKVSLEESIFPSVVVPYLLSYLLFDSLIYLKTDHRKSW